MSIKRASKKNERIKILVLGDSPQMDPDLASGFASVNRALCNRWAKLPGVTVEVWAIGFTGYGYSKCPYKLHPAGAGGEWQNRLDHFLQLIQRGDYTHVWIMQDLDILCQNNFPQKLKAICGAKKVRTALYFPMDSTTDPAWTEILAAVDVPVAYTKFGALDAEAKAALAKRRIKCKIIPHGVDTAVYHPITTHDGTEPPRDYLKLGLHGSGDSKEPTWVPFRKEDDFCLGWVATNQFRKDPLRALEILAGLIDAGVPAKLVMHTLDIPQGGSGGVDLELAASQLGLELGKDWMHTGPFFRQPGMYGLSSLPETGLNKVYNSLDLLVVTALGEGWGLPITEAASAGLSVALPMHTACEEIYAESAKLGMRDKFVPMMLENGRVMGDTRLRRRLDLADAIATIKTYYESGKWKVRSGLTPEMKAWLDWNRIASVMLNDLVGSAISQPADFDPKPEVPAEAKPDATKKEGEVAPQE